MHWLRSRHRGRPHSRSKRSIFCALSKFLAASSPIGSISLVEARSAPLKSAPSSVTRASVAPPKAAPRSEALVRSAFWSDANSRSTRDRSASRRIARSRLLDFRTARISPMDWFFMSAPRLAPVSTVPTSLAPVRSAVMRAPERLAPSSVARCICAAKMLARVRLARLRSASTSQAWSRIARSSFASRSLVLLSLAPRRMAPERSRPERSRPESFLPARSAGWRAVAEATAASTSARVISADAISGDARSTCCIMPWEAAGMAHARPNIPIAPIRIDARLIVSLYLGAVAAMTNGPSSLSPSGYARDHLHDHVPATVAGMRARHLSRSIERITWLLAKCRLGRCYQRKPGNDAFARRKTVGLGAGGRRGAITGRRCRTQRLSDGGARRLRVRLHEGQWGDAAGVGEVLLLHRRDRIDPALRSLCRGGNLLEPVAGAWSVRSHVPIA